MYYLHSKGIVHGDLKVSNVMVENNWEEMPEECDITHLAECNPGLSSGLNTPPYEKESMLYESPWSPKASVMSTDTTEVENQCLSGEECLSPKRYDVM